MSQVLKFSQLSQPRRALVRLCQRMNFGQIRTLHVQDGDPVFDPRPAVLVEARLDADEASRPEAELPDFALPAELCRLLARLDEINNGLIERVEVRGGIPRRVVFESKLAELLPTGKNRPEALECR